MSATVDCAVWGRPPRTRRKFIPRSRHPIQPLPFRARFKRNHHIFRYTACPVTRQASVLPVSIQSAAPDILPASGGRSDKAMAVPVTTAENLLCFGVENGLF